jgi:transmembrane sensor
MTAMELDTATQAAVGWLVVLHSGSIGSAERRDFDAWLAASPAHSAAWQRLAGTLDATLAPARQAGTAGTAGTAQEGRPGGLPGSGAPLGALLGEVLARQASRERQRRRLLRGALGIGGVSAGAALLAERHLPLSQLSADLRTGTGERRDFTLADGSRLTLDARSAADVDFRAGHRTVTLRQGALVAQAAPMRSTGNASGVPFIVRTAHGTLRALGTRFVVRQGEARSHVGMLEHSVEIRTAQGQTQTLPEGFCASFGPEGIVRSDESPAATAAWQHGMLEAHDQTLGEVVQALRAYRAGFIRVSPEAAALRVYGSYALDDTHRALTALGETLPISVRTFQGHWLVVIERL